MVRKMELLTKQNLLDAVGDSCNNINKKSGTTGQVTPEKIKEIEELLKNDSAIENRDLVDLLDNGYYQLAQKATNLKEFKEYIDHFVKQEIDGKSGLDLLVETLIQVVENKTKESSKILSNVNSEQSQKAVKRVQEYIDKRANGYSRRIIAIIGTGICIFIGIVSVIAATVAGVEEDDSSAVIVAGVFGAVVDAIGLALAICFFLYERKDDARKMQKDIVPGLDSAITAINCGTIINNGIITLGVGKAAEVVANAVCPVCNVKQNDICDICGHSFTDIPATSSEESGNKEKSNDLCAYYVRYVFDKDKKWIKINGMKGEDQGKIYLDELRYESWPADDQLNIETIYFSNQVKEIYLTRPGNGKNYKNIKAINDLPFRNVKKIAFEESKAGYILGDNLFNGLADIDYYGLNNITKAGRGCFGGCREDNKFLKKTQILTKKGELGDDWWVSDKSVDNE